MSRQVGSDVIVVDREFPVTLNVCTAMAAVGQFLLTCAIVVAPWVFGCVQPWPQFVLAAVIAGLSVLRAIEAFVQRADATVHIPLAAVAPLALLLIAALQLLPRANAVPANMEHAVFAEYASTYSGTQFAEVGTLSAASTRREAARLYFALAAFLLAAQWFADGRAHRLLFGALAINGAALGVFGIVQGLSWNGMMFWSVELRFGGTPFASYVNRNNAAGYLNLSLAATIGWALLTFGTHWVRLPGSAVGRRSAIGRRDRLLMSVAQIEGRHLAVLGLFCVTVAAVIFSLSRGGILAMLLAGAAVVGIVGRRGARKWLLLGVMLLAGICVALLSFTGRFETIDDRLATLSDPLSAVTGRVEHWRDTLGAVRDFPVTGTGFGTYRYANQPYQSHPAHAWYYNADNEWFELLVETGAGGLAAALVGFLLLSVGSFSLLGREDPQWRAAGAVGLFAMLSQGIQGLTDFGLAIPANAVTFAVLGGAVCGAACRAAGFQRLRVPLWLSLAQLEGRPSLALLNAVLTLAGAAFLLELFAATSADAFRDAPLEIDRDATRIAAVDAAIAQGTRAVRFRPDDGELHRTLGLLWIDRYELQMYRQLLEEMPQASQAQQRQTWRAVSLPALAHRAQILKGAGDRMGLDQLRGALPVAANLPSAAQHLRESQRYCPLARGVALMLARLDVLERNAPPSRQVAHLHQALFAAPSNASHLIEAGTLAYAAGEVAAADQCWRRACLVSPQDAPLVWELATQGRDSQEVIGTTIPRRADVLVAIAERVSDEETRKLLAAEASEVVKEVDEGENPIILAKLADLRSQPDSAIRYYRLALADRPWQIEWRNRLAQLLRQQGRVSEAEAEYSLLSHLVPTRRDFQQERDALRMEAARQRRLLDRPDSRE